MKHVDIGEQLASMPGAQELPRAVAPATATVPPGGAFGIHIGAVAKRLGDIDVPMLAYNGSIPGPTLRVAQGSRITVDVENATAMDTTIHWHGLRLENRYDGVPHETQAPIPPGGRYTHTLTFPDAGLFWYHPHVREDYAQEMGLYGNVLVEPAAPGYWPLCDREVVLTLDDILLEDGEIASFRADDADHAAMGRFGNVLLIGGEIQQTLDVTRGEVVRLLLTNTANTRVFRVAVPGAAMKLVGGDAGRHERETWIDDVVIAPSERAVVDLRFSEPGTFTIDHRTPERTYALCLVRVRDGVAGTRASGAYEQLRVNAEMVQERQRIVHHLAAPPDKTLALVAVMDFEEPDAAVSVVYVCPMHPEIVRDAPGRCPICGMKLMPQAATRDTAGHGSGHDHGEAMADGIEWEDLMVEVNRATTSATMHWKLVDRDTGAANREIDWQFSTGDQVKIRLVNEMDSNHPMHHPFHIHGERFLVLSRNGTPEPSLVWKDTVLVRTGQTVDILLDASNPGLWMAHCHIAEHMETGMMFSFRVAGKRS